MQMRSMLSSRAFLGDGRAHAARRHGARGGACRCDVVYVGMGTSAVCSTDGSDGLHTTVCGGRAVVRFIGLGLGLRFRYRVASEWAVPVGLGPVRGPERAAAARAPGPGGWRGPRPGRVVINCVIANTVNGGDGTLMLWPVAVRPLCGRRFLVDLSTPPLAYIYIYNLHYSSALSPSRGLGHAHRVNARA